MSPNMTFAVFATAFKTVVAGVLLLAGTSAHATLMGATVDGVLGPVGGTNVTMNFNTPLMIPNGAGPEFIGMVADQGMPVPNELMVEVDLSDSLILITTTVSDLEEWGLSLTGQGFTVSLTILDWLGPTGMITNVVPGSSSGTGNDPWARMLASGSDFVDVTFQLGNRGDSATGSNNYGYLLTIERAAAISEPATLGLLVLGLAAIGSRRRGIREQFA